MLGSSALRDRPVAIGSEGTTAGHVRYLAVEGLVVRYYSKMMC